MAYQAESGVPSFYAVCVALQTVCVRIGYCTCSLKALEVAYVVI